MPRKVALLLLEAFIIVYAEIMLLIVMWGGFAFRLGAVKVSVYDLKTPLLLLLAAILVKRFLSGSFFHDWLCVRAFRHFALTRWQRVAHAGWLLAAAAALTVALAAYAPMQEGLVASHYANSEWAGTPSVSAIQRSIDLAGMRAPFPEIGEHFSVEWRGAIYLPASGEYQFATLSDDGSDIEIDGRLIVDNRGAHGLQERTGAAAFERGFHAIRVRYMQETGGAEFQATWKTPRGKRLPLAQAPLFPEIPSQARFWLYRLRRVLLPLLANGWALFALAAFPGVYAFAWEKTSLRKYLSPLTANLLLFFLANSIGVNLLLASFKERTIFSAPTTLHFSRFFLTSPAHTTSDSWATMSKALDFLHEPHDDSLYATVFFNQRVKFQYPPASLLLLEPLYDRTTSISALASTANVMSWLMILATIPILARLFTLSLRRFPVAAALCEGGRVPITERAARLLLAACFTITFYPLMKSFDVGQIQSWMYFLLMLSLWAWMAEKKALAGVLAGLICIIKPQIGLLLAWGALRKQWRFAAGLTATVSVMLAASLAAYGLANHLDYPQVLSFMAKHGESYYPNQSLNGLLNRLLFNGTNLHGSPIAFAPHHPAIAAATALSSALFIAAALFWNAGQRRAETTDLFVAMLSFTMASPIAWEHHYSIMLPMFAVALPATLSLIETRRGLERLTIAFLLSSNFYKITNIFAETRFNALQSYLFFGALLFLRHLYALRDAECENNRTYADDETKRPRIPLLGGVRGGSTPLRAACRAPTPCPSQEGNNFRDA